MDFTYQTILEALPHRFPFLLVDKITEIDKDTIVGVKNVTFTEPFFQGHFPENPIFPGVLMVEACAQLSGILLYYRQDGPSSQKTNGLFAGIENFSFKKIVRPGDQLILKSTLIRSKMSVHLFNVSITVIDEIVGSGVLKLIFTSKK